MIGDRDLWMVFGERDPKGHVPRRGFGPESLRGTLRHLYDRGDRECTLDVEKGGTGGEFTRTQVKLSPGLAASLERLGV